MQINYRIIIYKSAFETFKGVNYIKILRDGKL